MTLFYNVLAQRLIKPQNIEGINTFWSPKCNQDRPDDRPKTQPKSMYNTNNEQQQLNRNKTPEIIDNSRYSKPEKTFVKKNETDGLRLSCEAVIHCNNKQIPLEALTSGVIAKVPVVLAGLTLQLNLESIIHLPEWIAEIKQVKKRVKITQCVLLQDTNVLFVKGLVCRNIEYTTKNETNKNGSVGELRHLAEDTPFKCTTEVRFNGVKPTTVIPNSTCQIEYLKREDRQVAHFSHKDDLLTCDISEFNQISTSFYNEMPFCELVESKIIEVDEVGNSKSPGLLNGIEGKMIIYLTLKILQYQQVAIAGV